MLNLYRRLRVHIHAVKGMENAQICAGGVVLKQSVAEETTKSGIVLPGQAKEKPQYAEVIEVGPGAVVDGKLVPMDVKVGDTVIYQKFAGSEVKLDDEEYIVIKQDSILAIVEK